MIKNNKWKLIAASSVILLPALFGAIVWNQLPDLMPMHWGASGNVDGVGGKLFTVLGLPLILLALFWLGMLVTAWDHKRREQDPKILGVVLLILPLISLWANGLIYAAAFGLPINPLRFVGLLFGILFMLIGNYLPKSRPNRTFGIRTKQTLANEENWYATHRFAGKVWFLCGILALLTSFLPMSVIPFVMGGVLLAAILPTAIFPYAYSRKQIKEGSATREDFKLRGKKLPMAISLGVIVVILALVAILMFTGGIEYSYGETSFTVDPTYSGAIKIDYEEIRTIEYREELDRGSRMAGFGSPRLSLGNFNNEEYGAYYLYAYTGCDASVVLYMKNDKIIVLGGSDAEDTQVIYHTLCEKIGR